MLKLAFIASNIQKYQRPISNTIVGVVTDVTRPLYREKEGNYIVMVKIVDESLNDSSLFGVMTKDCCVYLISKKKSDIDFIRGIGDIVLLDRFTFSLWNNIKLETKYLSTTQGIYLVDFAPELQNNINILEKLTMNPELLDLTPLVAERIKEIASWRDTQFHTVYQPKLGVNIINNHCVMVEPFSMLLRFVGSERVSESLTKTDLPEFVLFLQDDNKNEYMVRHHYSKFAENNLLIVRGIRTIGQSLELILTDTGNVLKLKCSSNQLSMNYMAIHRDNQKIISRSKQNQFTTISCESLDKTWLHELAELQDKYDHSKKKEEIFVKDLYLVSAVVINFEGLVSLYHRQYQVLLHQEFYSKLSIQEKKQYKEYNRISYIYEGVLGLFDRSNQSKPKPFYACLFTCDASGNFIPQQHFDKAEQALGTSSQSSSKKQLEELIERKLENLMKSSFENPVSLVLEPIRSERLLFRIANTKFL